MANGGTDSRGGSLGDAGTAGGGGSSVGGIPIPVGYSLVWHDEFEVEGPPDPSNYGFETGLVRNNEAQWYQAENASVVGGLLVIEARREHVVHGDQAADYTSASLHTKGLRTFQYGRFEMRARIPTSLGAWPAWWTLGTDGEWPSNGEIDIMEFYQNKVLANVACGTETRWEAKWNSQTRSLVSLGADWSSEFHVWSMDWDEERIVLLLDGQPLNSVELSSMLNPDGRSPFRQEHYMLVNLAIGGDSGGDPSSTTFPLRYEIDYLRVFQKD